MSRNIHVILVHGTFEPNAEWVRPDSFFREMLAGGSRLHWEFSSFAWSGKNSVSARYDAAHRLKTYIREAIQKFPDAGHYIIGHSHGGSIALKAMEDAELSEKIAGVVCLSTPFINPRPRTSYAALLAPTGFLALTSFVVVLLLSDFGIRDLLLKLHVPGWLFNVIAWYLAVTVCSPITNKLIDWGQTKAKALARKMLFPDGVGCKVLLVRALGDEASGALATGQFLSWMSQSLITFYFKLVGQITFRKIAILLIASIPGVVILFQITHTSHVWEELLLLGSLVPVLILCALALSPFIFSVVSFVILLWVGILFSFAVGREMVFASMFLDISVDSTPPGNWDVETIAKLWTDDSTWDEIEEISATIVDEQDTEPQNEEEIRLREDYEAHRRVFRAERLYHSATHEDAVVIVTVRNWIKDIEEN